MRIASSQSIVAANFAAPLSFQPLVVYLPAAKAHLDQFAPTWFNLMDARTLTQIAELTAGRYKIVLDPTALDEIRSRLARINQSNLDPAKETDAVEAALRVLLIEAARLGMMKLDGHAVRDLFSRLCPLPPIC